MRKVLRKGGKEREGKRPRPPKYSGRARQVLTNAWALAGTPCGQYLRAMVADGLLGRLVENGELRDGPKNKGYAVSGGDPALGEAEAMSSATMDRYLKEARKGMEPLARSTTRQSSHPLKGEIPFGKSYALVSRPGYLSTDTVAHCGNTMRGDHIRALNSTDVYSGQTSTCSIKGRARKWIIEGHDRIFQLMPFKVVAVNYDGGSEFINYEMIDYSALHNYQMTRSRPYHKNDNCHVEHKELRDRQEARLQIPLRGGRGAGAPKRALALGLPPQELPDADQEAHRPHQDEEREDKGGLRQPQIPVPSADGIEAGTEEDQGGTD